MSEGAAVTYADLAAFPDDHVRREIIDGTLIAAPSPRTRHQRIVGRLYVAFANHLALAGGGDIVISPFDVVLSDRNVTVPDLAFVGDHQRDIVTDRNIEGSPALVIEVLSDPRADRVRKRDLYARFGVPEYWIVDPDADRVEIHRLAGDRYPKPEILEPGETLSYEPLPGFTIDLWALFAREEPPRT